MKHLISSRIEMDGSPILLIGTAPQLIPDIRIYLHAECSEGVVRYANEIGGTHAEITTDNAYGQIPTANSIELNLSNFERLWVIGPAGSFVNAHFFLDEVPAFSDFSLKNPHSGGAVTLRGQLHCHSTNSDGQQTPIEVNTWYRDNGDTDFIAITDHNVITPDPGVSGIIHILGEELDWTVNGKQLHRNYFSEIGYYMINHPYFYDRGYTYPVPKAATDHFQEIDIESFVFTPNNLYFQRVWDFYLSQISDPFADFLWGVSATDSHYVVWCQNEWHHSILLQAAEATKKDILANMVRGNFYASQGNLTMAISQASKTLIATISASSTVEWRGKYGILLKRESGVTTSSYTACGKEHFIRAIARTGADVDSLAASQPIFIYNHSDMLRTYELADLFNYLAVVKGYIDSHGSFSASRSSMGADLSGTNKWKAGVLGPDGKIYGIPYSATDILIIDPVAGTATRSAMGADLTGSSKWAGGVLASDGKIYCLPDSSTDILIIDPVAGTATRSAMGADLTGSGKWVGGVLASNGKIYGMPYSATDILIIDPIAGTATRSAMGATLSDASKFTGGALGPDGKIYGIPFSSTDILIIDPIAGTATRSAMGATLTGTYKWIGGILGPDGKIYGIPWDSTNILIIDPIAGTATRSAMGATLTDGAKWMAGAMGPDGKIYGSPYNATDILIIDPIAGTATRSAMGADLTGLGKWYGGVLASNGKIYGVPYKATDILINGLSLPFSLLVSQLCDTRINKL